MLMTPDTRIYPKNKRVNSSLHNIHTMKYGKVEQVNDVDFSFPKDHVFTQEYHSEQGVDVLENVKLYVGCAKWSRPEWKGIIYPAKTKSGDFLHHYSRQFNGIELNTTRYGIKKPEQIRAWYDQTPEDFVFAPKFPESVTHYKQLRGAYEDTMRFIESVEKFEDKLGPAFLQLSDRFGPNRFSVLTDFLDRIPRSFRLTLELRHPEWFSEEKNLSPLAEFLREKNITWLITDTPGRRDGIHQVLTASTVFIRFAGCDVAEIDNKRIDDWVERLGEWVAHGVREIHFYVHNIPEENSPALANTFITKFNERHGTAFRGPRIGAEPTLF